MLILRINLKNSLRYFTDYFPQFYRKSKAPLVHIFDGILDISSSHLCVAVVSICSNATKIKQTCNATVIAPCLSKFGSHFGHLNSENEEGEFCRKGGSAI